MFVGFIAVIIIVLVITILMSLGSSSGETNTYTVEAKKVHALMSNLQNESKFYYSGHGETYLGISMDYFKQYDFAKGQLVETSNMTDAEWEGWPTNDVDGGMPGTYTGPYIRLDGVAGDDMRIIANSVDNGKYAVFFILKRAGADIPEGYLKALERALALDPNYIGG
jgi:hypothetical protein